MYLFVFDILFVLLSGLMEWKLKEGKIDNLVVGLFKVNVVEKKNELYIFKIFEGEMCVVLLEMFVVCFEYVVFVILVFLKMNLLVKGRLFILLMLKVKVI